MYQGNLEPITNKQTWSDTITVLDDNGAVVNIAGAAVSIAVREQQRDKRLILSGSTTDGTITFPGGGTDGNFKWTFSASQVGALCATRTYDVGVTITIAGVTTQLLLVTIAVLDGIVA